MKTAIKIKSTAHDANDAVEMAETYAIAKDQDWENESSTYVFDDNSTLTVCGSEFTAVDHDET